MGEQTCIVLVGFVVIHVALVLSVVGLATPVWIKAFDNSTIPVNATQDANFTTKGFWERCEFGECAKLNQTGQTGNFRASQVFFTLGVVELIVGVLGMYLYLAVQKYRQSKPISIISSLNILLADVCLLAAVIIFGVRVLDETTDLGTNVSLQLGWSFYCGVAAVVLCAVAFLAVVRRTMHVARREPGYEDI